MAGLPDTQPCPECGKIDFEIISFLGVPTHFLRTTHSGARIVTVAYFLLGLSLLLWVLGYLVLLPLSDWLIENNSTLVTNQGALSNLHWFVYTDLYDACRLLLIVGMIGFAIGWWKLTKRPNKYGIHGELAKHTFTLRLSSLSLASFFGMLFVEHMMNHLMLYIIVTVCLGLFIFDSASFMRKIAELSNSPKLQRRVAKCGRANFMYFAALALMWVLVVVLALLEPEQPASRATANAPEMSAYDVMLNWAFNVFLVLSLLVTFLNTVAVATLSSTLKSARRLSPEATA